MELAKLKEAITGEWRSISTEILPSVAKNDQGELEPFYLRREPGMSMVAGLIPKQTGQPIFGFH